MERSADLATHEAIVAIAVRTAGTTLATEAHSTTFANPKLTDLAIGTRNCGRISRTLYSTYFCTASRWIIYADRARGTRLTVAAIDHLARTIRAHRAIKTFGASSLSTAATHE